MDEKEIKKLFSELPPLEDQRSKEEILAGLKEDTRLQTQKKHKIVIKKYPAIIALAAMLVISFLVPTVLKVGKVQQEQSLETPSFKTIDRDDATAEVQEAFDTYLEDEEESVAIEATRFSAYEGNVLLADELKGAKLFRIGLVSGETVIPVSFLIQEDQIQNDFLEEPNSVQLYNQYAKHVSEENLGFDAYHPLQGKVSVKQENIVHQLPKGKVYDLSSATIGVYKKAVQSTFQDFLSWKVVDEFGNHATTEENELMKQIQLSPEKDIQSFYKQVLPSGQTYLLTVPEAPVYETLNQALLGMKERPNDLVEELVPEGVTYKAHASDDLVTVTFQEALDLQEMPHEEALAMIEGFMLTAETNGKQVQLKNIVQESFDRYDLMKPLPKPVAVNPLTLAID